MARIAKLTDRAFQLYKYPMRATLGRDPSTRFSQPRGSLDRLTCPSSLLTRNLEAKPGARLQDPDIAGARLLFGVGREDAVAWAERMARERPLPLWQLNAFAGKGSDQSPAHAWLAIDGFTAMATDKGDTLVLAGGERSHVLRPRTMQLTLVEVARKIKSAVEEIVSENDGTRTTELLLDMYVAFYEAIRKGTNAEERRLAAASLFLLKGEMVHAFSSIGRDAYLALVKAMSVENDEDPKAMGAILAAAALSPQILDVLENSWPNEASDVTKTEALKASLILTFVEIGAMAQDSLTRLLEKNPSDSTALRDALSRIDAVAPASTSCPIHQIRARFDDTTVTVYQAYNENIARAAVSGNTLRVPGFKTERMTWIKPSFNWMLYRAGYGLKDPGQQKILAITLQREAFDALLAQGVLAQFVATIHETEEQWRASKAASSVTVQWDPERDIKRDRLAHRAIQIGLKSSAVETYLDGIVAIEDVTELAHEIAMLLAQGEIQTAQGLAPQEVPYPCDPETERQLGIAAEA
jgi:hypothetical protein